MNFNWNYEIKVHTLKVTEQHYVQSKTPVCCECLESNHPVM